METVTARVINIFTRKFQLDLSTAKRDVQDTDRRWARVLDGRFQHDTFLYKEGDAGPHSDDVAYVNALREKLRGKRFNDRNIQHPNFKNVSRDQAVEFLSTEKKGEDGDVVFRPSTRSNDELSITMRIQEDNFIDIPVKQQGKTNPHVLGTSLVVHKETFEDLDHILAAYTAPLFANFKSVIDHNNFRYGDEKTIQRLLIAEHKAAANKKKIGYFLSLSTKRVGAVVFTYMISADSCKARYAGVTHTGFPYQGKDHKSLARLISAFKQASSRRARRAHSKGDRHSKRPSSSRKSGERNRKREHGDRRIKQQRRH
jgi:hypothetical protein